MKEPSYLIAKANSSLYEDENGDFINSPHCDKSDCFEWEHYGEAMKLLGGTENAEN